MRIVLDGVFNHTGRGFWAFHHILENGDASPYLDWYREDRGALAGGRQLLAYPDTGRTVNAPGQPGEDASSLDRLGYEAWWGLPALPKLNTDYQPVRDYLLTVAEHWIRFGVDGWRLDVPEEIADPSFWQAFRSRVRAVNPDAYLVGEIWRIAPEWLAGDRFDAVMNYPLAEAILGFTGAHHLDDAVVRSHHEYSQIRRLSGEEMAGRLQAVLNAYAPETTAVQLNLLDSHDTPRIRTLFSRDEAAVRMAFLLQATRARRAVHLLRRRDRPRGRQRPGLPALVPVGRGRLGPADADLRARRPAPAPRGRGPARRGPADRRDVGRLAGDPALGALGPDERRARRCAARADRRQRR